MYGLSRATTSASRGRASRTETIVRSKMSGVEPSVTVPVVSSRFQPVFLFDRPSVTSTNIGLPRKSRLSSASKERLQDRGDTV